MSYYVEHPEKGRLTEKGGWAKKGKGKPFDTLYLAIRAMRRAQGADPRGRGEVEGTLSGLEVVEDE